MFSFAVRIIPTAGRFCVVVAAEDITGRDYFGDSGRESFFGLGLGACIPHMCVCGEPERIIES